MKAGIVLRLWPILLAVGCDGSSMIPAAKEVTLTFSGTVTTVFYRGTNQLPVGVEKGKPVTATVTYSPDSAQLVHEMPGSRIYGFPEGSGHATIETEKTIWAVSIGLLTICDNECDGDVLDITGSTANAEMFPGIFKRGSVGIRYADRSQPHDFVSSDGIPRSNDDVNVSEADTGEGWISSAWEESSWFVEFAFKR